jgi:glyoxylase-like metal-dependent hydrolase (beta-lactamase superfamily II)
MRDDPLIRHWDGETLEIAQGVTLLRLGGHFPGGTVLHWTGGAEGRGALLSGDIVQVAMDLNRVSFLWSYPNMMPLAASTVRRIADTLKPWPFDRIYGAFPGRQVMAGGAGVVARSARRYIELLEGRQE